MFRWKFGHESIHATKEKIRCVVHSLWKSKYYSNIFQTFTSFILILLFHPHLVWMERMFGINDYRFMAQKKNVNCVPWRPSHLSSCSWTMFYYLGLEHDDTKPFNMSWTPKESGNLLKCSWIKHTSKELNCFWKLYWEIPIADGYEGGKNTWTR